MIRLVILWFRLLDAIRVDLRHTFIRWKTVDNEIMVRSFDDGSSRTVACQYPVKLGDVANPIDDDVLSKMVYRAEWLSNNPCTIAAIAESGKVSANTKALVAEIRRLRTL